MGRFAFKIKDRSATVVRRIFDCIESLRSELSTDKRLLFGHLARRSAFSELDQQPHGACSRRLPMNEATLMHKLRLQTVFIGAARKLRLPRRCNLALLGLLLGGTLLVGAQPRQDTAKDPV